MQIVLLVLFQKLSVTEHPLYIRLLAGPDSNVLSFVLRENEIEEVQVSNPYNNQKLGSMFDLVSGFLYFYVLIPVSALHMFVPNFPKLYAAGHSMSSGPGVPT